MRLKKVLKYIKSSNSTASRSRRKTKPRHAVVWENAPDVEKNLTRLIRLSNLPFNVNNITSLRSYNSRARAYARIWGLSRIWQLALKTKPHYVIEVLSEKYDKLTQSRKNEILLHELAHIPNNFSGSLIPHIRRGKRNFRSKVDRLIREVRFNNRSTHI